MLAFSKLNSSKVIVSSFVKKGKSPAGFRFKHDDPKSSSKDGEEEEEVDPRSYFYPNTSVGIKERSIKPDKKPGQPLLTPFPPFPDGKNPKTGEVGGPSGPEPTQFGDWQRKGRVTDF